jgi:hypothetical protein
MPDVPSRRQGQDAAPSVYAGVIRRLAPEEDPAHVEAWMLSAHGTLDAIRPTDFARAIKTAADRARHSDRGTNDDLARSYGL